MKKWIFYLLLLSALPTAAQIDSKENGSRTVWPSFLNKELLPDASRYLPAPPPFDSYLFVGDMAAYYQGKALRQTPRGEQARREADLSLEFMLQLFSAPTGRRLTAAEYPLLADLVSRVITDGAAAVSKAKQHFQRQRPFLHFADHTLIPEEEDSHHTPSYPSSHAAAGWALALVLSELFPEQAEDILHTGLEYGQSRVIAGYHYQSDVDAARLAASACVARLHATEAFVRKMEKVRRELRQQR